MRRSISYKLESHPASAELKSVRSPLQSSDSSPSFATASPRVDDPRSGMDWKDIQIAQVQANVICAGVGVGNISVYLMDINLINSSPHPLCVSNNR